MCPRVALAPGPFVVIVNIVYQCFRSFFDCQSHLDLTHLPRNPAAAAQILAQLKANICNKADKLICCPPTGWADPADNEVGS